MEQIADLPAGVIGLRASGELTRKEYRDKLEPALRDAVEGGDVRLLLVLEDDFSMSAGAFAEDEKVGWQLVVPHKGMEADRPGDRCRVGQAWNPIAGLDGARRDQDLDGWGAGRGPRLGCRLSRVTAG